MYLKKTLKKGVVKHVEICFDWFKDTVSVLKQTKNLKIILVNLNKKARTKETKKKKSQK